MSSAALTRQDMEGAMMATLAGPDVDPTLFN